MGEAFVTAIDARYMCAAFCRASEAIVLVDDDARYVGVNAAATALTGFSECELCAMTFFDITPAPSLELGRAMWAQFNRQGSLSGDYVLTRKDGSCVEVEFRAVANIVPGVHMSALRDVTEQRRFERERHALLKAQATELERLLRAERLLSHADALFGDSLDAERVSTHLVDLCLQSLADFCAVEQVDPSGTSHRAIGYCHPETGEALRASQHESARAAQDTRPLLLNEQARSLDPTMANEYPAVAQARELGFHSALAVPLLSRGRSLGTLVMATADDTRHYTVEDLALAQELGRRAASSLELARLYESAQAEIDERKRAEQALQKSEENLLQAAKMEAIGRLSGGIAHDFNNLLMVIIGYSDMALSRLVPSTRLFATLREIKTAAQRAEKLTQQLLAFSRKQILEPKSTDLNDVVASSATLLRRIIGEDIQMRIVTAPHLWTVKVDPDKISQVIMNLAANARDAMPEGGVLTIATANVVRDSEYKPGSREQVRLTVTDTGVGMAPDTLARIFEPFFTTKLHGKGTGLGLAMAYGIVQQSGGSLEAHSILGHGTTFDVCLPRCLDDVAPKTTVIAEHTGRGVETILLVEDEDQVRTVTRHMLETYGYRVIEAADGLSAMQVLETTSRSVALIVTDVVMPRMGGREFAERVWMRWPDKRVLFMSGYTDDAGIREDVGGAKIGFVHKPVEAEVLARKVRETLDARSIATSLRA